MWAPLIGGQGPLHLGREEGVLLWGVSPHLLLPPPGNRIRWARTTCSALQSPGAGAADAAGPLHPQDRPSEPVDWNFAQKELLEQQGIGHQAGDGEEVRGGG